MKVRSAFLPPLLGLVAVGLPGLARAEIKLATFKVRGMVCSACPISVSAALEKLPGVRAADARLETEEARVLFDVARQAPERLAAAIDRLGFRASVVSVGPARKLVLCVDGLADLGAARRVEGVLASQAGVRTVMAAPRTGEVFVDADERATSARRLLAALASAGFGARLAGPSSP